MIAMKITMAIMIINRRVKMIIKITMTTMMMTMATMKELFDLFTISVCVVK